MPSSPPSTGAVHNRISAVSRNRFKFSILEAIGRDAATRPSPPLWLGDVTAPDLMRRFGVWIGHYLALNPAGELRQGVEALRCGREPPAGAGHARERRALSVRYQSMSRPSPVRRVIEPHAVVHDGFRWHARAFDREIGEFRDFVLGRTSKPKATGAAPRRRRMPRGTASSGCSLRRIPASRRHRRGRSRSTMASAAARPRRGAGERAQRTSSTSCCSTAPRSRRRARGKPSLEAARIGEAQQPAGWVASCPFPAAAGGPRRRASAGRSATCHDTAHFPLDYVT
jgi:hypothetical protein